MTRENNAEMRELNGQELGLRAPTPTRDQRPGAFAAFAPPIVFLLAVGLSAMGLLYLGARDLVLPMLFLSLPLATFWLIVNDRQRRD